MNQITVNFGACEPTPQNGYNIQYRVLGSVGAYTDAGNFTTSPAEFLDLTSEPAGTDYEGVVRSDCQCPTGESGPCYGNDVPWEAIWEAVESGGDNSSCGTMISQETTATGYVNLGLFDLNIAGSSHVDLSWTVYDRPNRFTLYDNGSLVESTGWKGTANYMGPWGASLSTSNTGVIGFNPIAGHIYELRVEVGNADPDNPVNDNFDVQITCV